MTEAITAPAMPGIQLLDGAAQMLQLLSQPNAIHELRLETGVRTFDSIVAPRRGQLVVVGAENGSGKSTYLLCLLLAAARNGVRCGLFSIEDTGLLLRARILGLLSGVNPVQILDGKITEDDFDHIGASVRRDADTPLWFVEGVSDSNVIAGQIVEMAQAGAQLVVVDYLQTLSGTQGQDRRNEMRVAVQKLAHVAREQRICLVLASQVIRPQTREVGNEPNRHWLKEAGDIADAADKILMIWREQSNEHGNTQLKLCKDKDGRHIGLKWEMWFDQNTGWLRDVETMSHG